MALEMTSVRRRNSSGQINDHLDQTQDGADGAAESESPSMKVRLSQQKKHVWLYFYCA